MDNLEPKLRLVFFIILPYILTVMAWGWWWILWLTLINLSCNIFGEYRVFVKMIIVPIIAGNALYLLLAGTASGWLLPIIYWILCFVFA